MTRATCTHATAQSDHKERAPQGRRQVSARTLPRGGTHALKGRRDACGGWVGVIVVVVVG